MPWFNIARLSENYVDIIRQSFVDIVSQLDPETSLVPYHRNLKDEDGSKPLKRCLGYRRRRMKA